MAEKDQQAYHPPAANGYARSDEESATVLSKELRRKRNKKRLAYLAAFVVFQTIVIVIFSLTVMKVKRPKFRVRSSPTFENFSIGTATTPSFNIRMNAQVTVKNTNFGQYKFDNTTMTFSYRGTPVGEAFIAKSKAKMLSTKKINIRVDLGSSNLPSNSELGSDINSGILPLTSHSKLDGKVHLMMVMKKKKSTQMNCTMEVVLATQAVQNLKCR